MWVHAAAFDCILSTIDMCSLYHRDNVEMHLQHRWQIISRTIRVFRHGKIGFQPWSSYCYKNDGSFPCSRSTEDHKNYVRCLLFNGWFDTGLRLHWIFMYVFSTVPKIMEKRFIEVVREQIKLRDSGSVQLEDVMQFVLNGREKYGKVDKIVFLAWVWSWTPLFLFRNVRNPNHWHLRWIFRRGIRNIVKRSVVGFVPISQTSTYSRRISTPHSGVASRK